MKILIAALSLFTASLSQGAFAHEHMKFKGGAIHAHADWVQGPTVGQESILQINWMNGADHTPMELPGSFTVTLLMPDMSDMKSPPTQITRIVDAAGVPLLGQYEVGSMFFTMSGKWDVQVNVKYTDGSTEAQFFELSLDGKM